ncbi:phosphoadenylyl-sulfate reductase [PVC group bacterium]|nr:phosphoadenylyl-sulfate reductase [PVC group bacterium]
MIDLKKVREDIKDLDIEELIKYILNQFGKKVALASSLGAEDQVLTHIMLKLNPEANIFTLDTGRLNPETYDVLEATNRKYDTKIEVVFPDFKRVEKMVNEQGPNLFYESVENRKLCCQIRKVEPLKRKLSGLEAWITGLRKAQSVTRNTLDIVELDEKHGILKFNPLADWSHEDVWGFIKKQDVPYNKLHEKGYASIGCAPCTRAIGDGEDVRAGRWWWEDPQSKECGLHIKDGKLVRKGNIEYRI